jgi:HEAT repeat protein
MVLALLLAGPGDAEERRALRDLVETSPLIVIGEVTGTTAYADGMVLVHVLRVAHTLQGSPRKMLAIVEEPRSSLWLYREGQRVLAFLKRAPTHSLIRKSLPKGEYHATVDGKDGVSEIAPEADEHAHRIIEQAARSEDDQTLIRLELGSGHSRFVADAIRGLYRNPGIARSLTDEDMDAVRSCLRDQRVDEATRAELMRVLGKHQVARAVPILRSLEPSSGVLLAARAEALAALGFPPGAAETERYLRHADPEVRQFGLRQLASSAGDEAVDRLKTVALNDPDRRVRVEAVAGLGRDGGPEAVRALRDTFDSTDIHVQRASAQALNQLSGPEVEDALHGLVREAGSFEAQARALYLLFMKGARRDDPAIQQIARDHPDPRIRKIIKEGVALDSQETLKHPGEGRLR